VIVHRSSLPKSKLLTAENAEIVRNEKCFLGELGDLCGKWFLVAAYRGWRLYLHP
jgi:hypothetical protein